MQEHSTQVQQKLEQVVHSREAKLSALQVKLVNAKQRKRHRYQLCVTAGYEPWC